MRFDSLTKPRLLTIPIQDEQQPSKPRVQTMTTTTTNNTAKANAQQH